MTSEFDENTLINESHLRCSLTSIGEHRFQNLFSKLVLLRNLKIKFRMTDAGQIRGPKKTSECGYGKKNERFNIKLRDTAISSICRNLGI